LTGKSRHGVESAAAPPKKKQRAQRPRVRKKRVFFLSTCVSDVSPRGAHSDLHVLNLPFWGVLANIRLFNGSASVPTTMPYSSQHVAAMLDDWEKAKQLIDGETPDDVHVCHNMTVEKHDSNLTSGFRHSKKRGSCQHSSISPPISKQL